MKYALTVKQALLFTDLSLLGCTRSHFKKVLGIDYTFPECLIRANDIFWNFDNDTEFNDTLLKNKTLDQAVTHFNTSLGKVTQNLENITKKIVSSKKMQSSNKNELFLLFKNYYGAYSLNMPCVFHYWNVESLLIGQLKEDFHAIFGEDSEGNLQQMLIPAHETYFAREKNSMQKIVDYVYKNKKLKSFILKHKIASIIRSLQDYSTLENLISQHIKDFGFTTTSLYLGNAMSKDDVVERLKSSLEDYSLVKKSEQSKLEKNATFYKRKLLKQRKSYPEIEKRLQLACELMYWKNQRLDVMFKSDFLIHPLLENIAAKMQLGFHELVYLRYGEILKWFKTGKLPKKQELAKRIKNYALYLKNGSITLLTNEKVYPRLASEKAFRAIRVSSKLIKGDIACRGKVKGNVRIVLVTEDIQYVKRGEILVTPMTRPDMILGMAKAAAFVTDHGGMLSHAAIVAREMKKPCIVGTQNATKLLKTGMFVEVDANNGIVKVLN